MFKKIIAISLCVVLLLSLTGCDWLNKGDPDKPIPTPDLGGVVHMEARGELYLNNVDRLESETLGFNTVPTSGAGIYKTNLDLILDMQDNRNNRMVFSVYDRFYGSEIIGQVTYNGASELLFGDLSAINLGKFRKEMFNLTQAILDIDFTKFTPPEFEDLIPDGVDIEIDFSKIDMMDYLMSILYSMDTTALSFDDEKISEMLKEENVEFNFAESFELTVGVYSIDGLFDSLRVKHKLSDTLLLEMVFQDIKFASGDVVVPNTFGGVDISEKDAFKVLQQAFDDMQIGESLIINYELNNGYNFDDKGNVVTKQNQIRVTRSTAKLLNIDIYQRAIGQPYSHLFNITSSDFFDFTVTLKTGLSYAVPNQASKLAFEQLIPMLKPFIVTKQDLLNLFNEEKSVDLFGFLVSAYDGTMVKQDSRSTALMYYLNSDKVNKANLSILKSLKSAGLTYDEAKGETISDAAARAINKQIEEDLKAIINKGNTLPVVNEETNDDVFNVIKQIISAILGGAEDWSKLDKIYDGLAKELFNLNKSVLDGIMPLPNFENANMYINFVGNPFVNLGFYGDNGKEGTLKRFANFSIVRVFPETNRSVKVK